VNSDPYTLEGARRVLADTPKGVEQLDRLLGLAVLGSGVGYPVTGVSQLFAVFGWVDQKNELSSPSAWPTGVGCTSVRTSCGSTWPR